MTEYRKANEVETVAQEVMSENHALLDQRGPHTEWIMVKPSTPAATVPDWKMRKIQGVNAYLALPEKPARFGEDPYPTPFIAVEVSERYWERLDEDQREGFLDHILSWLRYDYEKGKWSIEGPEFGEFSEVLERRGFWRPDQRLQRFAETVSEQLSLLPEVEEEPDEDHENLDVSITHNGRTVHTNTDTTRKIGERSLPADGVDPDTGEVLSDSAFQESRL